MGPQVRGLFLFNNRSTRRCSGGCCPERCYVYRLQICGRHELLGLRGRQYVDPFSSLLLSSLTSATVPVFVTELAPPALRGLFVGMGGFALAVGYALATYMGLAFYYSTNPSTQWRGPYGISLIITAYPLLVMLWTPESPRWLLLASRVDDARQVVRRLHNLSSHEQHHFAITEFYQMQKQTEYDRTLNPSYMEMFRRPSYRKRVMMTVGYAVASQSTAILGETYHHGEKMCSLANCVQS